MFSFIISLFALVAGYFVYGKIVDRVFGSDPERVTPAVALRDDVDYVPMPTWKVFMIQFLNIAGTGPIFGAIMGAKFGPSCYLWIVLGSIFAGGVHDYMSGMMSMRSGGKSIPDVVGNVLGETAKKIMLVFSLVLLLLVGVVFVYSPALIMADISNIFGEGGKSVMTWVLIVFAYYIFATLLPIDKLIGRIYPLFAFCLLFMAVALCACLFIKWPSIPEFWNGLQNRGPSVGLDGQAIFPCLFITVACGALSGFHSTQSPLMARCLKTEKMGRSVFYGAMITEGIVALIWAAVSSWFFFDGGMEATGATSGQAPIVVISVSEAWLGVFGGILAIIGVVAAPITSGDTAFRSARLILADFIHLDQKKPRKRFYIAIPMFAAASLLLWYNIADENGFNVIWRYFGLSNQCLAAVMLWSATAYLMKDKPGNSYLITLIPAVFITAVCVAFFFVDESCLDISNAYIPWFAAAGLIISLLLFHLLKRKHTMQ